MKQVMVIGIAGGSGSGKSTFSNLVCQGLDQADLAVIRHDSYYHPLDHLPMEERKEVNFDHPDSLDTRLMIQTIQDLRQGKTVRVPHYDFAQHTRKASYDEITPPSVLIVEGILIFADEVLRDTFDVKIFIDADSDDRLIRRIRRDTQERGREIEDVLHQYETTVKPMHLEFVKPSKRYADVIIPHGGHNEVGLDLLRRKVYGQLGWAYGEDKH